MCFNFSEYVSSYNIAEIARKIDNNFGREYKVRFLLLK